MYYLKCAAYLWTLLHICFVWRDKLLFMECMQQKKLIPLRSTSKQCSGLKVEYSKLIITFIIFLDILIFLNQTKLCKGSQNFMHTHPQNIQFGKTVWFTWLHKIFNLEKLFGLHDYTKYSIW